MFDKSCQLAKILSGWVGKQWSIVHIQTMPWAWYTDDAMGMVEDLDELGKLGQDFSSMDDLEKIDVGDGVIPRPTYVSAFLNMSQKQEIIELLKAYTCCFAWDYTKMPRLSRELVEHRLPIKAGFRPYKQGAQNFKPEIIGRVKMEVDRLLQSGFIQPCRYAD
jgi:hypothetical protein